MKRFDCVISGAGLVGSVTALDLAQRGQSVLLLDNRPKPPFSPDDKHHLQVFAIANKQLQRFADLGITQHMHPARMGHYHNMSVWDNASDGVLDFSGETDQPLGAMLENQHVLAATHEALAQSPAVTLAFSSAIQNCEQNERKVRLTVQLQGETEVIESGLLLVAEGARSHMREQLGIQTRIKPYAQSGLVCYIELPQAPRRTALQSFNPSGPVGMLPMNDGLFSIVWSLPEDEAKHWQQADESRFLNSLQAHINRDFGPIALKSERVLFPLQQMYAERYVEGRSVLLGDAAHTIHPLAGQGVNLGLADGQLLAELLANWDGKNTEQLQRLLKKYQRVRRGEVAKTSETMHALHHLFKMQNMPLNFLRGWGMQLINQFEPLKQWLLNQAGS